MNVMEISRSKSPTEPRVECGFVAVAAGTDVPIIIKVVVVVVDRDQTDELALTLPSQPSPLPFRIEYDRRETIAEFGFLFPRRESSFLPWIRRAGRRRRTEPNLLMALVGCLAPLGRPGNEPPERPALK